jgi:hypothetical protein
LRKSAPWQLHNEVVHTVCSPTVWSAVSSALANATLAGVLAGFMLNGIVMLLGGKSVRSPGYVQAACLLFAAFVALGLDSYLFGLVTGDTSRRRLLQRDKERREERPPG